MFTNYSTDDVGLFCRCEVPLALENFTFKSYSYCKIYTKQRLPIKILYRVEDELLDLGGESTDDYGLAFTHGDSIAPNGDLDVSGLGEFPTVLA